SPARARRAPGSTLFPYTTLFRSRVYPDVRVFAVAVIVMMGVGFVIMPMLIMMLVVLRFTTFALQESHRPPGELLATEQTVEEGRSEEHTSELQSRENLVCRLLLE